MHHGRLLLLVAVLGVLAVLGCSSAETSRGSEAARARTHTEPDAHSATESTAVVLERVSTAVPWPRGLRFHDGRLFALARGVHRSAGGPDPAIEDRAGTLFEVDPTLAEPVVVGAAPSDAVRANARVVAEPTDPPFRLWDRRAPSTLDTRTDRPYCTLVFDEVSQNFFVCGFSGIDLPGDAKFRKNATDSVLRYDLRTASWHVVESHEPGVVDDAALTNVVANTFYPHHDAQTNPPPHGLVNGPCGAAVVGRYLYVCAKDNTALARYDLEAIRREPAAGPPPGRYVFHRADADGDVFLDVEGHGAMYVEGTCALAEHGGYLYVAFRTTSQVLRFPLADDGALIEPLRGEYVAQFDRYDPETGGGSANIYDMTFDERGRLYVSAAYLGAVYRFTPERGRVFDARGGYTGAAPTPFVDLRALTGNRKARTGNITLDDGGNLYIASGNKDDPAAGVRGVIYRVPAL